MFCSALWFGSCDNPTTPENIIKSVDNNVDEDEIAENGVLTTKNFIFVANGLSTDSAKDNAVAAILHLPKQDGPWIAELVNGVEYNALFDISAPTAETVEEGKIPAYDIQEITLKNGLTLEFGAHTIYISIKNEKIGRVFYKAIKFDVSLTPAQFSKAPDVYSHITAKDKNKLKVVWAPRSGAAGYYVYVSTNSKNPPSIPYATIAGANSNTAEITDLIGDDSDGFLPNGETYYVWIKVYNDSGTTDLSPMAKRKTSDTVDPYFSDDIAWWDSGADTYEFYEDESGKLFMGYCTRGSVTSGLPSGSWEVLYHQSFDPVKMHEDVPHTTFGHYTSGEDLTTDELGKPSAGGVFIVKMPNGSYWGTYYWGHRTIQSSDISVKLRETGVTKNLQGTVHTYFSNAWSSGTRPAEMKYGGYTPTFEDAMDTYTYEYTKYLVAFVAIP